MEPFDTQVVAANRSYFDQDAPNYDTQEGCITNRAALRLVADHLHRISGLLQTRFPSQSLRGLDAGGGTGNIALQLRAYGITPDLVDVSSEMINQYLMKLPSDVRPSAKTVCSDIYHYLTTTNENYHLICFSSVLHHLADYRAIVELASSRLIPGGIIYTIHDPCKKNAFWHKMEMADYHLSSAQLFRNYLRHKIMRSRNYPMRTADIGAEPHVEPGIDDEELHRYLNRIGLKIIWHERYYTARTRLISLLHRVAKRPRGFSLAISR